MTRAAAAFLLAAAPALARADRGAFTVEAGGGFSVDSTPPPVGAGSSVTGTAWIAGGGVRYAFSNHLELSASGFWQSGADYYHADVLYTGGGCASACGGTLVSRITSWGAGVGARWVQGLVFRYFAGAEFGFAVRSTSGLQLVDSLGNAQYLADTTATSVVVAPVAGVEWEASDHVAFSVSPRLQLFIGGGGGFRLLVPLMVSYAWY